MPRSNRGERARLRAARGGSLDALEELFHAHWPAAYRAAYLVVHDPAAARHRELAAAPRPRRSEGAARMRLDRIPVPPEAQERSWRVVSQAFEERIPSPPPRRHWAALTAAALVFALAAAALSPPGRAVLGSVRDALGVEHAAVALVRLPADGRLLVNSSAGPWIVAADGSKRHLGAVGQ